MIGSIGRVTTDGTVFNFPIPGQSVPYGIVSGPDGALWFTDIGTGAIGRIGTAGAAVTKFPTPENSTPLFIATGPDGAIWFTLSNGKIGRLSVPPSPTSLFAATLPSSRSIKTGTTATAFATILNGGSDAVLCGIVPVTTVPAQFSFQTTDPLTNALTGTKNTRVSIAAGRSQSFVIAFRSFGSDPFTPTNVVLGFDCANRDAASSIVGVNSLLLTFDPNPVADMIAVGVTPSNDGIAHLTGAGGTGVFAIATANIGAAATLTARARLFDSSTAATVVVCETNPTNGTCKQPAAATTTRLVSQNETATWAAFLTATGSVPLDPARYRVAFEFIDGNGVVRGSTSTALSTQ
jgi:hypothetical protein